MQKKIFIFVIALLFATPTAFAATFQIDTAHTQVHFKIAHLMVFKVRGTFDDFSGTVDIDVVGKTLNSAQATIKVASINTRNQKREKHLLSADFFDAANYPEINFNSKKVSGSGPDISVTGDLTIKGITKEVTLKGVFLGAAIGPMGNQRAGFEATGKISRSEFGLTWNKAMETGGVIVGDEVEIGLEIEAVLQK